MDSINGQAIARRTHWSLRQRGHYAACGFNSLASALVPLALLLGVVGCDSSPRAVRESAAPTTPTLVITTGKDARAKVESKAQPVNPRAARFAQLDTNHDGTLTLAEFSVGRAASSSEKWFARRDVDGNGNLSPSEFLPASANDAMPSVPDLNPPGAKRDTALPLKQTPQTDSLNLDTSKK